MAIAAALIPAAIKIFESISQKNQANKYDSAYTRPQNQIPQAMLDALQIEKDLAGQNGVPGERLITEKLDQNAANTLAANKEASTNAWDTISGAQKIGENVSNKINDLGIAGAEYKTNAQGQLASFLQEISKLQQDQWLYNQWEPYMNATATSRSLREAGTKNLYSGASDAAALISSIFDTRTQGGQNALPSANGIDNSALDKINLNSPLLAM